jgi:hypothetical protein
MDRSILIGTASDKAVSEHPNTLAFQGGGAGSRTNFDGPCVSGGTTS